MTTIAADTNKNNYRTELILKKVNTLAPIPKILQEVLLLLNDLNASPHSLAKAISKDQSIVLKILTIANSPFYGLSKRVSSIEFAIMILGFNEIRNIVSALTLMETTKNKTDKYLDQKNFWLHSYITATISKKLANDFALEKSNEVFVAGLLHDIGIPIVHKFMHSDFVNVYELVLEGIDFSEAEKQVLGMTHGEITETLLRNWNIPDIITETVRYHHAPVFNTFTPTLSSIVHLADYMTQMLKIGDLDYEKSLKLDNIVFSTLHVKDLAELGHFIDSYREPLLIQLESLKYLV